LEGASVSQACPWQSVAAVGAVAVVTAVAVVACPAVAAAVTGVLACGCSVCSRMMFADRLCPQPCHLMQLAPMPVA
jgi:hypothetical protein